MDEYQNPNQPTQQQYHNSYDSAPVMSIGNWIVTMLIMIIPLVNIIMLIVWAASSNENPNRKNWAVAQLIFMAIGVVLWIFLAGAIISMAGGLANAFS